MTFPRCGNHCPPYVRILAKTKPSVLSVHLFGFFATSSVSTNIFSFTYAFVCLPIFLPASIFLSFSFSSFVVLVTSHALCPFPSSQPPAGAYGFLRMRSILLFHPSSTFSMVSFSRLTFFMLISCFTGIRSWGCPSTQTFFLFVMNKQNSFHFILFILKFLWKSFRKSIKDSLLQLQTNVIVKNIVTKTLI